MCWLVDSNYYYLDYKSSALPIKPNQLIEIINFMKFSKLNSGVTYIELLHSTSRRRVAGGSTTACSIARGA